MKAIPIYRPVTIDSTRTGERWFPRLHRHTDDSLLLYTSHGNDAAFAPGQRIRSVDNGKTWSEPVANVPRPVWQHSFDDGELYELDEVGVVDPNTPETAVFWGARSFPGKMYDEPRPEFVRVHLPQVTHRPLENQASGYPMHQWREIWNTLFGRTDMTGDEIQIACFCITAGVEIDDRLIALGYGIDNTSESDRYSVWTMASNDRGRTWETIGTAVTGDAMEAAPCEADLVQLKDGRLYSIMRVDGPLDVCKAWLYHMWSENDGKTWSEPVPMSLVDDTEHQPHSVWPRLRIMEDGTLVVIYGRPGKHLICDPSGTGTQWQGRFDLTAYEKETQTLMGVPEEMQIRRELPGLREDDSSDYLGIETVGPRELIVVYDAQNYVEHWNARPVSSALRMLRVRLED